MNDIKEKLDNIFSIMSAKTLLVQNKESKYSVEELIKEFEKIDNDAKESILQIIEDTITDTQVETLRELKYTIQNHQDDYLDLIIDTRIASIFASTNQLQGSRNE